MKTFEYAYEEAVTFEELKIYGIRGWDIIQCDGIYYDDQGNLIISGILFKREIEVNPPEYIDTTKICKEKRCERSCKSKE